MTQYEIWWAKLAPPAGERPVLLLTRPAAYSYLNKVICAEITTTIRGIPQEVGLGPQEGLPQPCVANFDNLRTIDKAKLERRLGKLPANRIAEAKRAAGHALAWEELL